MKIAYLANSRFPSERAHSVQIVNMCQAFAQLGHSVTLYVTNRHTTVHTDPAAYYGFELQFLYKRISVPGLATCGRLGFILASFVFAWNVCRILKIQHVDLVYSRHDWVLFFLTLFAPGLPLVYESHEAKFTPNIKWLLKRGCKLVVISEGIKNEYLKHGLEASDILVAHDAIDDSFFDVTESQTETRSRLGVGADKPIAMYIGGFDVWKGIETFFKASEYTEKVKFVVIGGNQREITIYSKEYPKVTFLGSRPYNELRHNQQAADMLVIPNTAKTRLSAEFTSPLKLFAHMASKVPIIASRVQSITSVVSEDHVYFFEADNPKDLAKAMDEVCSNSKIASEKSGRAFELSKRYTWKERAKSILSFCF